MSAQSNDQQSASGDNYDDLDAIKSHLSAVEQVLKQEYAKLKETVAEKKPSAEVPISGTEGAEADPGQEEGEGEGAEADGDKVAQSEESDLRSVYVGGVDYAVTPEQLEKVFQQCGPIVRVTIPCDKFSGHPKGFAYVEFEDVDSAKAAVELNGVQLRGRELKVIPKRTNVRGFNRGRGGRGRGAPRGGMMMPMMMPMMGMGMPMPMMGMPNYRGGMPNYRGGRAGRGRGRGGQYQPY